MLYDRAYMKSSFTGGDRSISEKLIIILIICFILQSIVGLISEGFSTKILYIFSFSKQSLSNFFIWSPFTSAFLHDGPLHLIMNLLGLYFIGRVVEIEIGKTNFCWLCFASPLFGSLIWLMFNSDANILIGSSTIVMALLSLFCFRNPEREITLLLFFILPCRLKPKWILLGVLSIEIYGFLFSELAGKSNIAHSAHLGGMIAGSLFFLILRSGYEFPLISFKSSRLNINANKIFKNSSVVTNSNFKVNLSTPTDLQTEVDRILDKINDQGFGSLSPDEKQTLEKAKGLLRK